MDFITNLIAKESFSFLKKKILSKKEYKEIIYSIYNEAVEDYKTTITNQSNKILFLDSDVFKNNLLSVSAFERELVNSGIHKSIEEIKKNDNILNPSNEDIQLFIELFQQRIFSYPHIESLADENFLTKRIKNINDKIDDFTFQPNKNWFQEQCKSSIFDLGNRYTPALNVELEISEVFEGLGRTEEFKQKFTNHLDQFLIRGKKLLRTDKELLEEMEGLENQLNAICDLFSNTELVGNKSIPISDFKNLIECIHSTSIELYDYYKKEENKLQKEKKEFNYYHKYGYELSNIKEFEYELINFRNFIHSTTVELANNPFLLLEGEAGIGKSHLIGDIVSKRIDNSIESIFLLGQHLLTDEDPWTQIFKRLQINTNTDIFLEKVNKYAKESNRKLVIFIDAINEGRGNYFWKSSIRSFIQKIRKYEWLGLVLSIRTSYKKAIFPKGSINDLGLCEFYHIGFSNIEY